MSLDSVRAVVLDAPNADPRIMEFAPPTLTPGSARLMTRYSEVCGTDVHIWHGKMPGVPFPMIPGHVSVGVLGDFNGKLFDVEGKPFREGDVVTFLDVHETCNHCFQCLVAKQTTRCPHRKVYGITYGVKDGLLGGWSEVIWLKPGLKLVRIPAELDPETFIGGGCGLVTAIHAMDRAEMKLGQSVVVLGAGPVGQSLVALAALSGAAQVIAVGDPASRLAFAKRMGATATIGLDMPAADRAAEVRRLTGGRGADVVIEAAGAPDAVTQALPIARHSGTARRSAGSMRRQRRHGAQPASPGSTGKLRSRPAASGSDHAALSPCGAVRGTVGRSGSVARTGDRTLSAVRREVGASGG